MININDIEGFFPENIRIARFREYMLKEYIHYKMLDILSKSQFSEKLSFIGGSCLRILYGIKRFSEDLDFDNFGMSEQEFTEMTNFITSELKADGYPVVIIDKEKDKKLNAFRRNINFPELLYKQGISGHKEKKFLIKIESQSHNFKYDPIPKVVAGFDVFAIIKTAPPDILLSMKISAMLERNKGRDFFDFLNLVNKTEPNYEYLSFRKGINTPAQLKKALLNRCDEIDFKFQSQDFQHLVFSDMDRQKLNDFKFIVRSLEFSHNKQHK